MLNPIRIDKYLAQLNLVSRREAKKFFRAGRVMVNGYIEYDHGFHVIDGDRIVIDEDLAFIVKQSVTILLNKPSAYVCSDIDDGGHLSYQHLLKDCVYAPMLKVAGRLDQDTTGLVVATSDGDLIHRIISPKTHRDKEYIVQCEKEVSDADLVQLEQWVKLEDDYMTLPAKAVRIDAFSFCLILREGKFHQVKRMCEAIANTCVALQRVRVGEWTLEGIEEGKWREVIS